MLFFTSYIGLLVLNIFGDFKVIIDSTNQSSHLHVLELDRWCVRFEYLKSLFLDLKFQHIYREHNIAYDRLSKEALHIWMGCLELAGFIEDENIFEVSFQAFS